MVWTLSGFADEIDPELDVQLRTLAETSIKHIELRGVWGKNVLALSDDELERVKSGLDASGVRVSAVGSPIGKIGIGDEFEPHVEKFRRAMDVGDDADDLGHSRRLATERSQPHRLTDGRTVRGKLARHALVDDN